MFALSFPLMLYATFFGPRLTSERSRLARSQFFFLFVMLWTYGSAAALSYLYGWKAGLVCLLMIWNFDKFSLRFFLRKWVNRTALRLRQMPDFRPELPEEKRATVAYETAEGIAVENCQRK